MNNKPTQLLRDIFSTFKSALSQSFQMMMAGLPSKLPMPGTTGAMFKNSISEQRSTSKSQRVVRAQRGSQPEEIGMRRIMRNASRALKTSNRYCNNIDSNGAVSCN